MAVSKCPLCNGLLEIQTEWVGQTSVCPHCKQNITISAPSASAVQPVPFTEKEKFCPKCGNKIGENDQFCPKCGNKIGGNNQFCPKCGNKISGNSQFCPKCGLRLNQQYNFAGSTAYNASTSYPSKGPTVTERICGRKAAREGQFSAGMMILMILGVVLFPFIMGLICFICFIILCCTNENHKHDTFLVQYGVMLAVALISFFMWIAIFS